MRKHFIALMIIGIVFSIILPLKVFSEETQDSKAMRDIISKEVNEICMEEPKFPCNGNCVDGFGEECYVNTRQYKKEDLQTDIHGLPEATRNTCFARHSYSQCVDCYNKFEVRKDGELKAVSCEEFYSVIKEKNKSCNDCIIVISAGCC